MQWGAPPLWLLQGEGEGKVEEVQVCPECGGEVGEQHFTLGTIGRLLGAQEEQVGGWVHFPRPPPLPPSPPYPSTCPPPPHPPAPP